MTASHSGKSALHSELRMNLAHDAVRRANLRNAGD
jgi:hypothetical protein